MGRTRLKGKRLPRLSQRLNAPTTLGQSVCLAGWYGNTERQVEYTTGTAVWYHSGKPVVPLRWVLVRDPKAEFAPKPFSVQT
ncbi:hypothetical protein [Leptodesmis sp.]|uniref:hypothetical protein n=1 Tax=Leptodesmis sp. TaxID=3100501 RepID=UPI0040534BE0